MPLTHWSQLEVSIPYLLLDSPGSPRRNGLGDVELGFRTHLVKPKTGPHLALNFEVGAPIGDSRKGLAGQGTELAMGLFATKMLDRSILFGNFSYAAEIPKGDGDRENILEYSTAAVFPTRHLFHPALELVGESNLTEGETEIFLAPQIILSPGKRLELKAAVPIGLTHSTPNWGVQFQITLFLQDRLE